MGVKNTLFTTTKDLSFLWISSVKDGEIRDFRKKNYIFMIFVKIFKNL